MSDYYVLSNFNLNKYGTVLVKFTILIFMKDFFFPDNVNVECIFNT